MAKNQDSQAKSRNAALWDRRMRNLRAIIYSQGMNGTSVAKKTGLGINTVNSILNGASRPKYENLEKICQAIGLQNPLMLDAENPLSEVRNSLFGMVQNLREDQAREAWDFLRDRFPDLAQRVEETEVE